MLVKNLMTKNVTSCHPGNDLAELAEVMWNQRCGACRLSITREGSLGSSRIEISYCARNEKSQSIRRACSRCLASWVRELWS